MPATVDSVCPVKHVSVTGNFKAEKFGLKILRGDSMFGWFHPKNV